MNNIAAPIGAVLTGNEAALVARTRSWNDVNINAPGLPSPAESNTAPAGKQKRQRSANWSVDEELTLISLFRDLEKQFDTKKQLWDQLAVLLQERGGYDRKPLSLEQKWGNMIQSYRAIKEHDRTKVQVGAKFFNLAFEDRKSLLHSWKVNSLDDKSFEAMDDFLRERSDVLRPERPTHSHSGTQQSLPQPPALPSHPAVPAIPVRHIEVNYMLPNNILGSVANTILVKMVDAERYFAKTAAHDVDKCKQYLGLLRDCAAAFKDIKDNMVNMPNTSSATAPAQPSQPQHYHMGPSTTPHTTATLSLPSAAPPQATPSTSTAPSQRHHPQQPPTHLPSSQQATPSHTHPQPPITQAAQSTQQQTPQNTAQAVSQLPQGHIHPPHQQAHIQGVGMQPTSQPLAPPAQHHS